MEKTHLLRLPNREFQTIIRALRFAQIKAAHIAGELVTISGTAVNNEGWQQHARFADTAFHLEQQHYEVEDLAASHAFINSLSSTQLDREFLIEGARVTLAEFLNVNLIQEDTGHITIEQAKEVVDLEIGGTTYAGTLVEIERIS